MLNILQPCFKRHFHLSLKVEIAALIKNGQGVSDLLKLLGLLTILHGSQNYLKLKEILELNFTFIIEILGSLIERIHKLR